MGKTFNLLKISGVLITLTLSAPFVPMETSTHSIAQETSELLKPIPPPNTEEVPQLKDVFFDSDKDNIRSDAESVLRENADSLKKNPNLILVIEGYSDARGTDSYNLRLGKTRADATKAYLVKLGIESKRIKTVAKGTTIKFSSESTEQAFQLNRRAHFILKLAQAPKPTESLYSNTDERAQSPPQASLTTGELSKALEYELKKLAPKQIIFNPTREMKAGVSQRVGVRISKTIMEDLYTGLRKMRIPELDKIELGELMKIHLAGNNFYIKPISHEEQTAAQQEFTEWDWDVTPLKTGTQSLLLSATVNIDSPDSGNESKDYPLYVKAVTVKFNLVYSTINFIKSYWLWIIGIFIISGIIGLAVKK